MTLTTHPAAGMAVAAWQGAVHLALARPSQPHRCATCARRGAAVFFPARMHPPDGASGPGKLIVKLKQVGFAAPRLLRRAIYMPAGFHASLAESQKYQYHKFTSSNRIQQLSSRSIQLYQYSRLVSSSAPVLTTSTAVGHPMAMRRAAQQAAGRFALHDASAARGLHAASSGKKIVGVFYKGGQYADRNPNFVGCAEHALGIRGWLEAQGHQYIVTDDKDGPNCELEKHIADAHVLITTPFHPAYVTSGRIARAKNLELLLTAGIGSDHVDLPAAAAAGLTVAEVTGSNTVSVAEDELMRILVLLRNFLPGHRQAGSGDWDVAAVAHRAYDLEGKTVGTVGAGRIGRLLLQRLKPFSCTLLYHDRLRIDPAVEAELGAEFEPDLDAMLPKCDVVVLNTPLTDKTRGMFDKERIARMKKGVIIVNNARGAIMDAQAVADACATGHIAGYSGDVWHPQPAPKDHPWRYMPNNAMTPHISGTTIDAQLRYAAGVKDMLERYFKGQDFPAQNYIVKEGKLASQYQ